jgi:peptide/nickel transport system substrate-binding protein
MGKARPHAGLIRAAGLVLSLALVAAACGGGTTSKGGGQAGSTLGVKGGTLRIASAGDIDYLDPATAYYTLDYMFQRALQRTPLSFDSLKPLDQQVDPVPDLAEGMPQVSADGLTYTLTLRSGIKYYSPDLPADRTVEAKDIVNEIERMFDKANPSGGQPYARLIKGADEFGDGKAPTISGLEANGQTLKITLTKPAPDFNSILTLPFFSPVPEELSSDHALKPGGKYKVGTDYTAHSAAEGPYYVQSYQANKSLTLVRNPNWDAATDPLRKGWVDKIEMKVGIDAAPMEEQIERGDVDLQGDTTPPKSTLPRIASDPELSKRFYLAPTPCLRYLALGTNPKVGPMANVKVRQAINYAVNKEALRRARGGTFAGDIATTILTPLVTVGYQKYDLYPTPSNQGDPEKAKALLREAGFPNGITVSYLDVSTGFGPAVTAAVQEALGKAGIKLKIHQVTRAQQITDEGLPGKRLDHEITTAAWCSDWPGDAARSYIAALMDGRKITPANNQNISEYNSPAENSLIDQALSEPDKTKRAALWTQADKQAMQDAVWVPYLYDKTPYFWSKRVHNWRYSPWMIEPDLTQMWLDPNSP